MSSTGVSVPFAIIAPGVEQGAPDVGALAARCSPRRSGTHGPSEVQWIGLHRGDDAELAEARMSSGLQVLRVLDPPAHVGRVRVAEQHLLVHVEGLAVGAVADGVGAELEAVARWRARVAASSSAVPMFSPV